MKREFSAGGVVFKRWQRDNGKWQILWLIAQSAPTPDYPNLYWRLPKGWIDDVEGGMSPGPIASGERKTTENEMQEAALREVREEGGVEAQIVQKIGTERYVYHKNDEKVLKFVTFYLMEWIRDLPEGPGFETSKVEWKEFEEVRKMLKNSGEKKILDKAKGIIDLL